LKNEPQGFKAMINNKPTNHIINKFIPNL